ncbi:hypothetical protein DL96DRAFT_124562 [Flagelloscypha sp. PMI_526]|nr:hypothetical protein DL96DRAFT_124562 [Flagelloscypha sp. PMI_526]
MVSTVSQSSSPSPAADAGADIKPVVADAASAPSADQPAPPKRKPSRRANTAERRATHNAVERARRETLNGRFLDLAALLPNLSQIRRPSKSAIVNSSIAHINASKRHRATASRELRALKGEADALRRELNEWRDRAALPRIEEPMRGEGFGMVLSGEIEVIVTGITEEDEEGDELEPSSAAPAAPASPANTTGSDGGPFYHEAPAEPTAAAFAGHQGPPTPPASSHGLLPQMQHPGMAMPQRNLHPMIANTQQIHFDPAHPSNMHGLPQLQQMAPQHFNMHPGYGHHHHQEQLIQQEKAAWNMGYAAAAHAQRSAIQQQNSWDSPTHDFGGRARSGSMSGHSFSSGSPPRSPGSSLSGGEYELTGAPGPQGEYGVPRGLTVNTQMGGMGMGGMVSSPISIVGGGAFGGGMAMGMM